MSDAFESQLREALERHAADIPEEAYGRLHDVDYDPRSPARRIALGTASVAGLAAAAGISLSLIGLGGGAQRAFAGWTPIPTEPRAGQRYAAENVCNRHVTRAWQRDVMLFREIRLREERSGHPSIHPLPAIGGPWHTILTDTRGPFTLVMLTNGEGEAHCLVGPGPTHIAGVDTQSLTGIHVGVRAYQVGALSLGSTRTSNGEQFKYLSGRAGRGVKAVRIDLADGKRISATIEHGWYLAWWPGSDPMMAIQAVSTHGASTQRFR